MRIRRIKRGQASGAGAAVLIAIITALIVIYILFLPPSDREALLEGDDDPSDGDSDIIDGNETILLETPGRLDYLEKDEVEHPLPSVNLVTTTSANVLESRGSLYVKNGWFDKLSKSMNFSIDDLDNTDNVKLSFNVDEYSGRLIIIFNGEEIFNSEITSTVNPIDLRKSLLKEDNNIVVKVSGVGLKFWSTNEYTLSNVQITADHTDLSGMEATLPFLVTNSEKSNLDRVYVKFFPNCNERDVAPLKIYLNNQQIFSSVPDCGILRPLEVSPHNLLSGENYLAFSTERGPYLIDNIVIKTELKELLFPTYYFEVNETIFDEIRDNDLDIKLYLDFVDDVEQKKAEIWINGHLRGLDTRDIEYDLNLDSVVKEGNNVIEIKPKTTLDIVNLKVVLEER